MAKTIAFGHKSGLKRVLGRKDLILLFVVAVANLNMVPPISASGPLTLWLWILALAMFFWPQGAAVTELSQKWPGEGGIYLWAKRSFGEKHGFLAGWCYWLSNVFYLPTVILSCIGVGLYVGGPNVQRLEHSHLFTGSVSIGIIVFLMLLNIRGLSLGKWINNLGGAGTIVGAALIVLLAALTVRHHGSAFHWNQLHQGITDWRFVAVFGTICYSLIGLDLASIMGDEIQDPRRNLPFSIFWGGLAAGAIYLGTTLAMLIAMPQQDIGILSGILQGINIMASHTGLLILVAPLAFLECIAILGTASAWFSGTARLPFVAGIDRYLPAIIGKIHPKYGTPYVSLIMFAILSSLLIGGSFFGSSVEEGYLTLLDLAVIMQLVPSAYMFLALLKHALNKQSELKAAKPYLIANCVAGLSATTLGLAVAFVPSRQVSSVWIYEVKLLIGCAIVFGTAYFFYRRSLAHAHQTVLLEVTAADAS
ncbi:Amino acid permease [Acidisarcina polymorpha]|uniref:Amino acid permease n=1 Tax=Acidisarcina polymorpha TaxID=2211140 RepID=A0A2Z5G347_9BACT|nr:APC family permease [Acidisarcina polymorpha]AXC13055.1 Amino acid permease [Acidisarcina polymorpha]